MKAKIICASILLGGAAAFATEYTWTPNAADSDNILTNPVHFSKAPEDILPIDILKFSAGGELRATLMHAGIMPIVR